MANYLYIIPLLPLAAAVINLLLGPGLLKDRAHWVAVPAVLGSFIASLYVFLEIRRDDVFLEQHLWNWMPSGSFDATVGFYADELTAAMLVMVTFVSLLVHIYSVGYMHGNESYYRFFSWLPLFVFSMVTLVLANNYLMIFFGWEAVGVCSYLLIGFFHKRRSAGNASKKAFIVNRIGDVGFALGIMMMFTTLGTVMITGENGVAARIAEGGHSTTALTVMSLLIFAGAVGKSAQFPLHVWLPDAMEGPTPVSALIHAATMVTAGIYLVARSSKLFESATDAMAVVTIIGGFTAFLGATIALTQNDIKRVVAYSTVSQLGYMTMGLGAGLWVSAIFHLLTHAFFKAGLFLGSGSVIHGMHEEQDIRNMGGLRKFMPITFITFLCASLANAGVIPFSGFWSKDELISGSWVTEINPRIGDVMTVLALITAFLSALYMFRLVFLVFFGKPRFDTEQLHPHESPPLMTAPLIILAVFAVGLGVAVGLPPDRGPIHTFLEPAFERIPGVEERHEETEAAALIGSAAYYVVSGSADETEEGAATEHEGGHEISDQTVFTFGVLSTIAALGGILVAYLAYMSKRIDVNALTARFPRTYQFLYNKWYFDEIYREGIVLPMRRFADFLWQVVDIKVIDGTIMAVAGGIGSFSQSLRKIQTGLVGNYALAIALGMVVIVGVYVVGFSSLFR